MNDLLKRAKELQTQMTEWRRQLHREPEIGSELPKTRKFVTEKLKEFGYDPTEIEGGSIVALISGPVSGRCIMIREDMDALPIIEEAEVPYKSTNCYMHACGHDMHTAMLLACAQILKEYEHKLEGTVKLLFQAGEETLQGAAAAIAGGVLENPSVDAAITLHVDALSQWPDGVLTLAQPGAVLASCDTYHIDITGKGGHGAYPDQAIDPINAAAHIHIALQEILSRELCASEEVVLTQGVFKSGDAPNIIPHTAHLEGTLRTYDEEVRKTCLKRMEEICCGIAQSFRAEADFTVISGCASFYNDPQLFEAAEGYLLELVEKENYIHEGEAGVCFASEDFSNISQKVPSIQLGLVVGSIQDGCQYPMHHPKVAFQEKNLYRGAAALAYTAVRYLQEHH